MRGDVRGQASMFSYVSFEARIPLDHPLRPMRGKRGKESKLSYMGDVLTENRHGLVVDACLTQATGYAEREAATSMLASVPGHHAIILGADKGYDTQDFVDACRSLAVTPHVAQNTSSRIDGRTTRHGGYAVSQRRRKQVEEVFG